MTRRRPPEVQRTLRLAARVGASLLLLGVPAAGRGQSIPQDTDRIDITGRQNLTLGSGARAYGMGGAFLARADDATAANWNPAGLSYLRLPEVSLVGASNAFDISRGFDSDHFQGQTLDFAAFTWPIAIGEARGATQLSYQRAVSFDGRRRVLVHDAASGALQQRDEGRSNGGFDVVALGAGLRLTRSLRLGFTVNRWVNGYDQTLTRDIFEGAGAQRRPRREFTLDFRPSGWSANLGAMWSPFETLNVGLVYKTGFRAKVDLAKTRLDPWMIGSQIEEITTNAARAPKAELAFPASSGVGLSWRPHDTFTVSADFTVTRWSRARIYDYFNLTVTNPDSSPPPPVPYEELQYPTLFAPPGDDSADPLRLSGQHDKQELRLGAEYVLIRGSVKIPLRAGYFNDRQITPDADGALPRFKGFTAGAGIVLGPVLLDLAYVYEFGSYYTATGLSGDDIGGDFPAAFVPPPTQRRATTTHRVFASIIYRFNRR